jgi:hypothetical protein
MKTKKFKTKVNSKSGTMEMLSYFIADNGGAHVFWANFKMEDVIYHMDNYRKFEGKYEGFRSQLYDTLLKLSLDPDPEPWFYSLVLGYLCGDKVIQKSVRNYSQGGTAIIGHINVSDESLSTFQFLDSESFDDQLKKDFSIIPFKKDEGLNNSDSKDAELTIEELIFLSILVEIAKIDNNDHSRCYFSNEEILKMTPIPNRTTKWIAETLGKLHEKNIINVGIYLSNGTPWYRDIFFADDERCNHIQFSIGNKLSA